MPVGSSVHRRRDQIDMSVRLCICVSDTILILSIINNNFAWFFLHYLLGIPNYTFVEPYLPHDHFLNMQVIDSFFNYSSEE